MWTLKLTLMTTTWEDYVLADELAAWMWTGYSLGGPAGAPAGQQPDVRIQMHDAMGVTEVAMETLGP